MRAVRAGPDAAIVGWAYIAFGVVGIAAGWNSGLGRVEAVAFLLLNVVLWVGVMALAARDVRRASAAPAEVSLQPPVRVNLWLVPFAVVFLTAVMAIRHATVGMFFLASGASSVGLSFWIARFERRRGYVVLRRFWTWSKSRYLLTPQEDTPPAQRKPAHAQSEAARRAP